MPNVSQCPLRNRSAAATSAARARCGDLRRERRVERRREGPRSSGLYRRDGLARTHASALPRPLARLVANTRHCFAWRHASRAFDIPADLVGRHGVSARPETRLLATARVARVVDSSDASAIGIGVGAPNRIEEAVEFAPLALVNACQCALHAPSPARPHRRGLEVVETRASAATDRVERLLRKTAAAVSDVVDGGDGSVVEAERRMHIIGVAARDRVHLGRAGVEPPAQRVDEVTTLADEARPFEVLVRVPASMIQAASIHEVARRPRCGFPAETGLHPGQQGREAAVEADHEPVIAGSRDHLQHPVELVDR